jgi:predicted PurR-regulated permease PerM
MTPELEQQLLDTVQSIQTDINSVKTNVHTLNGHFDRLSNDVEKSNDKFANYQQAVQWVIQLAFSLIASATITIIISSVLRK